MRDAFLGLIVVVCAAAAAPDRSRQANPPMEIGRFGVLSTWSADGTPERFANLAATSAAPHRNIGLEWRAERDVREVRVRFTDGVPQGIALEYWFGTWPPPPPKMPTIEDPSDDPWQGKWLRARTDSACDAPECRFTFQPLHPPENELAGNLPGVRYRRTLKLRLVAEEDLPPIASLSAFSDSVERPLRVRVQLGIGDEAPAHWTGSVEVSNGDLRGAKPFGFTGGDRFESAAKWAFTSGGASKGLLLDLIAASPSLPGSLDSTLVTVRAEASETRRAFTFNVEDLARGGIYIPDCRAWITDAAQPAEFRKPAGRGPRIRTLIPKEPEQTWERARREIPPIDPWQNQYNERTYMLLAPDSSWQKFAFEYGGNVYIRKNGTKAMGKERERLLWEGDRIAWKIGTGRTPYYRDDRKATASTLDGYLPVVVQHWENEGLQYTEEAFVTLLRGPLSPDDPARSEQTPAVLMLRLTAENTGASPKAAHVWLSMDPGEQLRISGRRIEATGNPAGTYAAPRLRAVFAPETSPEAAGLGNAKSNAAHFPFAVPAGSAKSVIFALPFVSDLTRSDAADLERLDYDAERTRVVGYWKPIVTAAARISTPEKRFDNLMRAVVWHIRMDTTKDPVTGLYMVPAAGYDYKVYANEACFQALMLDAMGQHATAAQYLETFLRLQGSKGYPGMHRGMEEAIFHGARVNEEYDYTASNYGLDHSTVLWALGEHYLYSRDRKWLEHAWPHIDKAIAWILKQREATRRTEVDGRKAFGYGLLPASSLEDNADWQQWFSINAFACAGMERAAEALADIHHPEAARIHAEADRYRAELRNAVLRATEEAPVRPLRDGTYAPSVPIYAGQQFHRFGPKRIAYYTRYGRPDRPMLRLSATREVLYGPIILLNQGVFGADEPIANWILDEWEDNITLSSGLGLNVHGATDDRYWFSQGGMVFQANLQNPILVYLKRHEVPAAIRLIYNNYAALIYPGANAFAEEFREWRHASGPFYKAPDEAKFVNRIRDSLVLEDRGALYLGGGIPRRWLESREGVRVDHLPTYFGPVSYTLGAGREPGTVEAGIRLPSERAVRPAWLVVRTPTGRIQSVTVNGKPWVKIDTAREAIELPDTSGRIEVKVRYR